jgi:hypothetical protein
MSTRPLPRTANDSPLCSNLPSTRPRTANDSPLCSGLEGEPPTPLVPPPLAATGHPPLPPPPSSLVGPAPRYVTSRVDTPRGCTWVCNLPSFQTTRVDTERGALYQVIQQRAEALLTEPMQQVDEENACHTPAAAAAAAEAQTKTDFHQRSLLPSNELPQTSPPRRLRWEDLARFSPAGSPRPSPTSSPGRTNTDEVIGKARIAITSFHAELDDGIHLQALLSGAGSADFAPTAGATPPIWAHSDGGEEEEGGPNNSAAKGNQPPLDSGRTTQASSDAYPVVDSRSSDPTPHPGAKGNVHRNRPLPKPKSVQRGGRAFLQHLKYAPTYV